MTSTVGAIAHTMAPSISGMAKTRIMRRLPNMSPRRPEMGTATAAASSVAVMIQAVFVAEVLKIVGSCGMSGVTMV